MAAEIVLFLTWLLNILIDALHHIEENDPNRNNFELFLATYKR